MDAARRNDESYRNYTGQPRNCHTQYLRQVLNPLGVFNCPVYRYVPRTLPGGKHAHTGAGSLRRGCKSA